MSFLSSLLSFIPVVGPAAGALADVFGGAAGKSNEESDKTDTLKLGLQDRRLAAKKFATDAPGVRHATAERAALANAATPASVQWGGPGSGLRGEVPQFSGGIKSIYAANQNPEMRQLSDRVLHDQLVSQMGGGASGGNQDVDLGSAKDVGEGSAAGDTLGGLGLGLSIFDVLNKTGVFKKRGGGGGGGDGAISYPGDNGGIFEN